MMRILRNDFSASKSLSPVTIKSAFPAAAHSRIILSALSRQIDIFSVGETETAKFSKKIKSSLRSSGFTREFILGLLRVVRISVRIREEISRINFSFLNARKTFRGIPFLFSKLEMKTLVSITALPIQFFAGFFNNFADFFFRNRIFFTAGVNSFKHIVNSFSHCDFFKFSRKFDFIFQVKPTDYGINANRDADSYIIHKSSFMKVIAQTGSFGNRAGETSPFYFLLKMRAEGAWL